MPWQIVLLPHFPSQGETADGRNSQSIRNQESAVRPDHCGSGQKDPVQGDLSQHGPEQNVRSSVLRHDNVSHLEECQEYMLLYLDFSDYEQKPRKNINK